MKRKTSNQRSAKANAAQRQCGKMPAQYIALARRQPGYRNATLYIIPNTEKGIVDWKQAVTDEEYNGN